MTDTHLAFSLKRDLIRDRILIPKYYDPDLHLASTLAASEFELPRLGELLLGGTMGSRLGDWVRREHYGSGDIPYVRTSDLSHWRIRPDFKKGVSEHVYREFHARQDVAPNDILMVAHGTYLVGTVALVTIEEPKLVLQDHVFRLRVNPASGVNPLFLLAALSSRFVRRQIRARQFSADIIDKVGDRHLEVEVPIPRDRALHDAIVERVTSIIEAQSTARDRIRQITGSEMRMLRERAEARFGFSLPRSAVHSRILIPKYYDPSLSLDLAAVESADSMPWVSIGNLVSTGLLEIGTGVEVGKMAYGTGDIPFIRTSDIADLEVKRDIRHAVSESIYERFSEKAGLKEGDVLLVRDGTYLVGSSALVSGGDTPSLLCGGLFRLRSKASAISPSGLLAVLNLPVVRRQMRARQFTRDVIDTLGNRLLEVRVPSPASETWKAMANHLAAVMKVKDETKTVIGQVISSIEPSVQPALAGRPSWSMR